METANEVRVEERVNPFFFPTEKKIVADRDSLALPSEKS